MLHPHARASCALCEPACEWTQPAAKVAPLTSDDDDKEVHPFVIPTVYLAAVVPFAALFLGHWYLMQGE